MTETVITSGDIREREQEQDSKGNIYKVRDIRGADAPDPPRPLHEYQTFPSWNRASENQFCSKGRWLDMGYVVKTGEESHACVRIERKSAVGVDDTHATDNHRWPAEYFSVYHRTQVRYLKQPQRSRRIVIGRFLGFCDWLGYRRHDGGGIRQLRADSVHGSVKDLVYRSFLYRNRTTGIKVPIAFSIKKEDKNDFVADAFYVRAGELTRYFVLDLDNHRPTRVSTEAHLLLVERLVGLLPELLKEVGGGKVFYDYSQFAPRGIHIWVLLNHRRHTRKLHEAVRKFLVEHSEASLDEKLRLGGLPEMGAVEILPTESHLIRFFGAYDRSVFTTRELKPRDNAFDAEALLDHIHDKTKIGDPCGRYGELARAGLAGDGLDAVVPGRATIVPGLV